MISIILMNSEELADITCGIRTDIPIKGVGIIDRQRLGIEQDRLEHRTVHLPDVKIPGQILGLAAAVGSSGLYRGRLAYEPALG